MPRTVYNEKPHATVLLPRRSFSHRSKYVLVGEYNESEYACKLRAKFWQRDVPCWSELAVAAHIGQQHVDRASWWMLPFVLVEARGKHCLTLFLFFELALLRNTHAPCIQIKSSLATHGTGHDALWIARWSFRDDLTSTDACQLQLQAWFTNFLYTRGASFFFLFLLSSFWRSWNDCSYM